MPCHWLTIFLEICLQVYLFHLQICSQFLILFPGFSVVSCDGQSSNLTDFVCYLFVYFLAKQYLFYKSFLGWHTWHHSIQPELYLPARLEISLLNMIHHKIPHFWVQAHLYYVSNIKNNHIRLTSSVILTYSIKWNKILNKQPDYLSFEFNILSVLMGI